MEGEYVDVPESVDPSYPKKDVLPKTKDCFYNTHAEKMMPLHTHHNEDGTVRKCMIPILRRLYVSLAYPNLNKTLLKLLSSECMLLLDIRFVSGKHGTRIEIMRLG